MSLMNVQNTNGELLSKANNSFAIAEVITQDAGETDFESLRDVRTIMLLANVCDASSTVDTAVLNTPITEGDRIFIVDDANQIFDITAGAVAAASQGLIPVMTSMTAPSGTIGIGSENATAQTNVLAAFDGNLSTSAHYAWGNSAGNVDVNRNAVDSDGVASIVYAFENNEKKKVTLFKGIFNYTSNLSTIPEFKIQAANNSTDWVTIYSKKNAHRTAILDQIIQMQNPGNYSHYRLVITPPSSFFDGIKTFQLYTDGGQSIDTSAITKGAIPKHVYKYTPPISFNGVTAIEKDIYKEFGTNGSKLYVASVYNDVLVTGRTITTRVDFDSVGDELLELTSQVFKAV